MMTVPPSHTSSRIPAPSVPACLSVHLACQPHPQVDDRSLYAPGQKWVGREDIIGRARGKLPYMGMVTIILDEYPLFK